MKGSPPAAAARTNEDEFVRTSGALRAEILRLQGSCQALADQLAAATSGNESERASLRAALNLMEDAVLARAAAQRENDVRKRVEAELREANARKDELLTTLRTSEQALQAAGARQAVLLELTDRLRGGTEPLDIMRIATEALARYFAPCAAHFVVVGAGADDAVVAAAYATEPVEALAEGVRVPLGQWPEAEARLRSGHMVQVDGCKPDALCPLLGLSSAGERRSAAAVPLLKDGRLAGLLVVTGAEERVGSDAATRFHREIADRAWNAVERAAATAELREIHAQRAELLAAARVAQAQAERANRTKDEFLATLSHELRTPLAAILLWAKTLQTGGTPPLEHLERALRAIVESAESQSRLIDDLLDLSRLTAGKLRVVPAAVDVVAVVQGALEVVRPATEAKGLTLDASIDGPLGHAWLDPARLKQVLWNLLSNATKFTPPGGRIVLDARRQDGRLEIQVRDDGEGIAPEFMPYVFERFRQADDGDTRAHAGLGIGLALSRQLIELHGGTIVAESEGIGRGSVFRVSLPWVTPSGRAEAASPAAASPPTSLAGVTVLLVEDDAHTSAAMAEVLQSVGATVRACSTGAEALAGIAAMSTTERRSFVLVSDLGLPGMSGLELLQHIGPGEREVRDHAVPACAISARTREVDRERALEAGYDIYMPKPVSPRQLLEAVRDLRDIGARA